MVGVDAVWWTVALGGEWFVDDCDTEIPGAWMPGGGGAEAPPYCLPPVICI